LETTVFGRGEGKNGDALICREEGREGGFRRLWKGGIFTKKKWKDPSEKNSVKDLKKRLYRKKKEEEEKDQCRKAWSETYDGEEEVDGCLRRRVDAERRGRALPAFEEREEGVRGSFRLRRTKKE